MPLKSYVSVFILHWKQEFYRLLVQLAMSGEVSKSKTNDIGH